MFGISATANGTTAYVLRVRVECKNVIVTFETIVDVNFVHNQYQTLVRLVLE